MAKFFCLFPLVVWSNASGDAAGVASAHPVATQAGIKILEIGGNAFDAAVAVTSTIGVVEPAGSGMGGGGFWLLYDADRDESIMLDGREKAPLAAASDMYLDEDGAVIEGLSIDGPLAAAIPGEPAALVWLAENYGKLPLTVTLQPAIYAARNGFAVTEKYRRSVGWRLDTLKKYPPAAEIFLADGEVPEPGHRIIQNDLADTLWTLAVKGHDGFYKGHVAEALVEGVREAGGVWTLEDLKQYRVAVRKPIETAYHDLKLTSAALPSSGGMVLAQILNVLEQYDLDSMSEDERVHIAVEAMRRAYRDRAQYMGDSDFVDVPGEMLTDKKYARGLSQSIRMDRATQSAALAPTYKGSEKAEDTTHFSVIDKDGNRVAATLSINYPFGSGVVAEGTGVLLNDEMDDFSSKPGSPNVYGLIGAQANAIEPGKRMLSSMSPTFLEDRNRVAVLGTPGGSRIITMVLLAALEFYKGGSAEEIVNRPRFHHQYLPDKIQYEPGALTQKILDKLKNKGHSLDPKDREWGNMHAVIVDKTTGKFSAASDRRGEGRAMIID